jgi:alkylation response protein AidB-like acyl-CoA dehydrogenase
MDFTFSADQESLRKLTASVFSDERAADVDAQWRELGRADLHGLAVPTEHGGSGLGLLELCILFEQAGRVAAAAPVVPTQLATLAVAELGSVEQKRRLLPAVARGELVIAMALDEVGASADAPLTRATSDGAGFRIDGVKIGVAALERAKLVIVPARLPDGSSGLFLVDAGADGATRERQLLTDDVPVHQLTLAGVRVGEADRLGNHRPDALAWVNARMLAGLCAYELGIAVRQLELTAGYVVKRQQFGKPIGTFQAVAQRVADMYIDVESLRLTVWQAASRLADGQAAAEEVATAAYFAAEAGHRVATAAQHLHGGIGFDRAYPLHRYFLAAKRVELQLGGAHQQLARLGAILAAD